MRAINALRLSTMVLWSLALVPPGRAEDIDPSIYAACPRYVTKNVTTRGGATKITLGFAPGSSVTGACTTLGKDVENLVVNVVHETETRLHVTIDDAATNSTRYTVPESVFPRPKPSSVSPATSKLVFKYTTSPKPFSFTVSRKSTGEVLFSTSDSLIFKEQYLRLKTSLPKNANIYGLGEHSEPFRLDTERRLTRTLWSRDSFGIPTESNLYGNHPVYFEHRTTGTHGVFLLNSNGMDIKLSSTGKDAALEYNVIGGIFDFYFFAGSETNPEEVAKQYTAVAGLPAEMPYWGFGFHQCRFGYKDYVDVAGVITKYKEVGIPLETMWTDIDYMNERLIFTLEPQYFPLNRMREIVSYLHANDQHYILMTDPAVGYRPGQGYAAFDSGDALGIWMKNANGSSHLGVVWPGVTVYPDWFHPKTQEWWTSEFKSFYSAESGLDIDGAWIDMNEPASFCDYPCTDPHASAAEQKLPPARDTAPPAPNAPIFTSDVSTTSPAPVPRSIFEREESCGVSRRSWFTVANSVNAVSSRDISKRADGAYDLLDPPYAINNTVGALSSRTAYTDIVHANNLTEYDTHNLYGSMMSTATRHVMLARRPNRRPFIITRSTFAGAGRDVGKWLGDNLSSWEHYRVSIAGMLNFASIFAVPMVGSDVCGFGDNTTETLCARWATLGAFNPFYRNHNIDTGISQEFYVWPLTTQAAKKAIDIRYRLLDYIYTAFHAAHTDGSTVLSPVWYKYPKDPATFPIDLQFFYGPSILVSPVTQENSTEVTYYLPRDKWYNFETLAPVQTTGIVTQTNVAFTDIPLHIKGGSVLALRSESAMTIKALRTKDFEIVVAPDARGKASGSLYLDDGETIDPPRKQTTEVTFSYDSGRLTVRGSFGYETPIGWAKVKVLGQDAAPGKVLVDGRQVGGNVVRYDRSSKVVEVDVGIRKLGAFTLTM